MLKYTDTGLPCPTLSISKLPQDFLRTAMLFSPEEHTYSQGYIIQGFTLVVDRHTLGLFLSFWSNLDEGIKWFEIDFGVAGITGYKKARFNTPHRVETLALNLFRISTSIEVENPLIQSGVNLCPHYPTENLYPHDTLYPC